MRCSTRFCGFLQNILIKKLRVKCKKKENECKLHGEKEVEKGEDKQFREIEIREKRIQIVFKTIYVLAILLGTTFVYLSSSLGKKLNEQYAFLASIVTFLAVMIIYMVLYVIAEMRCMGLDKKQREEQREAAEKSYNRIFTVLKSSAITTLLAICILFGQGIIQYLDRELGISIIVLGIGMLSIVPYIISTLIPKSEKILYSYWNPFWATITVYFFLLTLMIQE